MAKDDNDFLDSFKSTSESNKASDDDHAFLDSFKSEPQSAAEAAAERTRKSIKHKDSGTVGEIVRGIPSGVADVGLTAGKAFYGIDELLGNKGSYNQYNEFLKHRNEQLDKDSSPGFNVGRIGGQVAATAPLIPARGFALLDAVATKPAASVIKGATSGGIFGGLTSASNPEKSVPENALEGATTGAIVGPASDTVVQGGKALASKAKMWVDTDLASKAGNLDPRAVKYILQKFEQAGLTPTDVEAELKRLGPKATIADIDPLFLDVGETIAKSGGTPSSMMKTRFENRADTANYDTTHIINRNLGGKPDLEALRERIHTDAQNATKKDYDIAHAQSGLDAQPIVDAIDKKLKTAVGPKAAALQEIKSYFYADAKDAQGNPIKVLRHDVEGLHEIRTQLDTRINDKNPTNSYDKNSLAAVKDIRANLDAELKSIPEMRSADEKFAEKMKIKEGVDIGENIFDRKVDYEQFANEFVDSSSEKQNMIREGIKGEIYSLLQHATKGELTEAQKLFGKNTANREKLKLAFGQNADEVLDALEKEAKFRATEQTIKGGARTGQIQAIQQELGIRPKASSAASDIIHGAMADAVSGAGGVFTAVQTAKRGYAAATGRWGRLATEGKVSGSGDILSRSGIARDNAVDTLSRVHAVRSRIPTQGVLSRGSKAIGRALPTLPIATSEYTTKQNEK